MSMFCCVSLMPRTTRGQLDNQLQEHLIILMTSVIVGSLAQVSGKEKAHKHVLASNGGSLRVGCPGVKDLCAIFGTKEHKSLCLGTRADGKPMTEGTEFFGQTFYVPFFLKSFLIEACGADSLCALRSFQGASLSVSGYDRCIGLVRD